jgi:glycerophosphoryl diester phosphodiesterase
MKKISKLILGCALMAIFLLSSGFLVVGHRGDPTKYPEETIQSDNSAFASGADYVELDVHLSADNVLVVSHDRDLARVTGISTIVSQNNFATLSQYRLPNGEHVMSLDQLFSYYKDKPNTKFVIETKKTKHNNPKNMESLLAECIKRHNMQSRVMIHSFSAPSLKTLSTLLPSVPRIFIVGSLKRINFDVLYYVNAVNVSADLIQKDPSLIHDLHAMGKRVFVWAEMNESPRLWNWLINNNVDGVVTNYPALGYRYKLAKEGSHEYRIDQDGYYLCRYATQLVENPYLLVNTKKQVKAGEQVHVDQAVTANGRQYYQIAKNHYVPAAYVSFYLQSNQVFPYWHKTLRLKAGWPAASWREPSFKRQPTGQARHDQNYAVWGFNGSTQNMWFLTKKGWLPSRHVLLAPFAKNEVGFWYYQQLPERDRQTNISLLVFDPLRPRIKLSYQHQLNLTHQILTGDSSSPLSDLV